MAVAAFGFSAGDFIAAIQLLHKAAKALRETSGACGQYQQAAIELNGLRHVLVRLQSLEATSQNTEIIQQIQVCSHACNVPLARFLEKLRTLERYLGHSGTPSESTRFPSQINRAGRKVQWALYLENHLAKLRAKIAPHIAAIEVLLQLEALRQSNLSNEIIDNTYKKAEALLVTVQGLQSHAEKYLASASQVVDIQDLVKSMSARQVRDSSSLFALTQEQGAKLAELQQSLTVHESLLREVAPPSTVLSDAPSAVSTIAQRILSGSTEVYSTSLSLLLLTIQKAITAFIFVILRVLPGLHKCLAFAATIIREPTLLLDDNIRLEDALGRIMSLPYQHFRYWPVVDARLRAAFAGLPGELKIKRGGLILSRSAALGAMR